MGAVRPLQTTKSTDRPSWVEGPTLGPQGMIGPTTVRHREVICRVFTAAVFLNIFKERVPVDLFGQRDRSGQIESFDQFVVF